MENQQKPKSIFKKAGFWVFMILVGFPMIYGLLFLDDEDVTEPEKQEVTQAENDSILALRAKARRDSLYRIASPEEKKVLDAQEKRRAEYEAKKLQRAKDAEERKGHKVFNSKLDNSVVQVEYYLKKNLDDPDSYESVEWYNVSYNKDKKTYSVRHKYRARNAFGAKVLVDQVFQLTPSGKVISVKNIAD